ncbi:MAG: hypothetical protein R2718_03630 [Solirubrobacterales bacterium]|nr:hypothetical protein [Solirubrobacterales bacterium]
MRPRLTYANVVATLALVLALGGGTVYAAIKLGKNDVKSRNIAPGAVQNSDLDKNAVKGPNIKNGAIESGDLSAKLLEGLDVDVTGSAKSGAQGGINADTSTPLPLSGKTTIRPRSGSVGALVAEGRFTIASTDPAEYCQPAIFLLLNGDPTRVFVTPDSEGNSTTLETSLGRDADGPFGLISPKTPLEITAELRGDEDCTPDSQLDRLEVRIVQIR